MQAICIYTGCLALYKLYKHIEGPPSSKRYIPRLSEGKGLLCPSDRSWANEGKPHPVSNGITSVMAGVISGLGVTALSVLAAPFLNSATRPQLVGTPWEICMACPSSAYSLRSHIKFNKPSLEDAIWENPVSKIYNIVQEKASFYSECMYGNKWLGPCARLNYNAAVKDIALNNKELIGLSAALIAAFVGIKWMRSCQRQEIRSEIDFINGITRRCVCIGEAIENTTIITTDFETQALNILYNRISIEKELEDLKLPHLSSEQIENIVEPIFAAARKVVPQDYV